MNPRILVQDPWIVAALCAATIITSSLLLARRHYLVVCVLGRSMLPSLRSGDRVLARRGAGAGLQVGTVVVFRPPDGANQLVIKRVAALPGDAVPASVRLIANGAPVVPCGMLVVLGDNPRATDSRHWGFIPLADVVGRVVMKLGP
jgi:signal peptidase I